MYFEKTPSPVEIIRSLGSRFKEYRMRMKMTQKDVAEKTAISIPTIYKFENGRMTDMSMVTLLKLLRVIKMEQGWDKLLPELPESPYLYKASRKRQRIRHNNKEKSDL